MKRLLLFATGVFFYTSSLFSQTINFESQIIQFGKMNETDKPQTKELVFTNTGTEELIISQISVDFKGIDFKLGSEKIKPGKSSKIEVTLNPKHCKGRLNKTLTVLSNSTENKSQKIAITAEVNVEKNSIVNNYNFSISDIIRTDKLSFALRNVKNTEVLTDTIKLLNCVNEKLTVGLERMPSYISIVGGPVSLEPYGKGELVIKVDFPASNKWGRIRERMYWSFNGEKDKRAVSLTANVEEDFSNYTDEQLKNAPSIVFEKKEFKFDTLQQGESVSNVFKFKNEGKSDLIIRNTKTSCGCTASKSGKDIIKPGEESTIDVTFNSRGKRGMQHKSITITTNDPKNSTVVLYMKGYVNYTSK